MGAAEAEKCLFYIYKFLFKRCILNPFKTEKMEQTKSMINN